MGHFLDSCGILTRKPDSCEGLSLCSSRWWPSSLLSIQICVCADGLGVSSSSWLNQCLLTCSVQHRSLAVIHICTHTSPKCASEVDTPLLSFPKPIRNIDNSTSTGFFFPLIGLYTADWTVIPCNTMFTTGSRIHEYMERCFGCSFQHWFALRFSSLTLLPQYYLLLFDRRWVSISLCVAYLGSPSIS